MKITTPEEFSARDPNATRPEVVDILCVRIERELSAGRRDISASCVLDLHLRHFELVLAAERYRAVGWLVNVQSHAADFVLRLMQPSTNRRTRCTVPGSTLADHIGSPDSASPYREGKDR